MKTCPNCGSILADNEPYCENCGFDPGYDIGNWNYGSHNTSKPYIHGEHIKSPEKEPDDGDMIAGFIFLGVLIVCGLMYLDMYHWDIGNLIQSNIESIVLLIIVGVVCYKAYTFFEGL